MEQQLLIVAPYTVSLVTATEFSPMRWIRMNGDGIRPHINTGLAITDELLTAFGGEVRFYETNKVVSWKKNG